MSSKIIGFHFAPTDEVKSCIVWAHVESVKDNSKVIHQIAKFKITT